MYGNSALPQGQAAQNTIYQQHTAPKEIGLIQRIEGVRTGLDQVRHRLTILAERIAGENSQEKNPEPMPSGIPGNLSMAEQRIREIFALLDGFEQAF